MKLIHETGGVGLSHPFLSVILPAYNEERRIGFTLTVLHEYFAKQPYAVELLVVDDGSTDSTSKVGLEFAGSVPNLKVLRNGRNRGKGYSIRRGVAEAKGSVIGFMDADYKTPIEEIENILPWLENGYEVVIGSRGLQHSRVEVPQPFYRRWGSRLFGAIMHALVGLPDIVDTQCGFKFFTRKAALDIFSRQKVDGYMFDVEILCLAQRLGYRVKEVPIRWINDPDSRLQLVRGNLRVMKELLQIRASLNGMARERINQLGRT